MQKFLKEINILNEDINPKEYSPLNLAYIGDSVFEICVRTHLMNDGNMQVNKLHNKAKNIVSATAQSKMYSVLESAATEEELSVLKRGRNAKSNSSAKNAEITDYRRATGLEALFGYLYLKKDYSRIAELFDMCIKNN